MNDGRDNDSEQPSGAVVGEDRWVYESILGAIPGVNFTRAQAMGIQLGLFGLGVVVLAVITDRWESAPVGLAAVAVISAGSVLMLTVGRRIRELDVPELYTHTLFGSQIEIVLGLLSYIGLVTYLFVADPRQAGEPLLTTLLGPEPSVLVVYFVLLVLWDVCYRIGTGWWASVVGLWRSVLFADRFDASTRQTLVRVDLVTIGFGVVQIGFLPFLDGQPLLQVLVAGHVVAVTLVSGTSILVLRRGR